MLAFLTLAFGAVLLRRERHDRTKACMTAGVQRGESRLALADGYSRVGCVQDDSPEDVRIMYGKAADGTSVTKTTGIFAGGMRPEQCFTFCRDKPTARFFMIVHGRDCYCAEYYHDISTGGGTCDAPCEGDTKEMCGGMVKASAFEMHTCGNNQDLATQMATSALEAGTKADIAGQRGLEVYDKINALSAAYQLPVCSKAPSVCAVNEQWEDLAEEVRDASKRAILAANGTETAVEVMRAAQHSGERETAEGAFALESGMSEARAAQSVATVKETVVTMSISQAAGPLGSAGELEKFSEMFHSASPRLNKGWLSVCALTPVDGGAMLDAGQAPAPARCGQVCLDAGDDCFGFNLQAKDGILACQLLSSEGIMEQDDSLKDAIPVIEVSRTKVQDMGLDAMDCYVKAAFMARNGGLDTKVLDTVFATGNATATAEEVPEKL